MSNLNNRIVDELRFWLPIMRDHAIFVKINLPCTETNLIQTAQEFENRYNELIRKYGCPDVNNLGNIVDEVVKLNLEFIQFFTYILDRILDCTLEGNHLYPTFVDHIRRETIHFTVNLIRFSRGSLMLPTEELIQDELFWLRIMAEHTKFMAALLDPSEERLMNDAQMFGSLFDKLHHQAEHFESMLEITPRPIPSLIRFVNETLEAGNDLRDFKAASYMLIKKCEELSLMPAQMAKHITEEAERFLYEIKRDLNALGSAKPPCPTPPPVCPPCPTPSPINPCPPSSPVKDPCPTPAPFQDEPLFPDSAQSISPSTAPKTAPTQSNVKQSSDVKEPLTSKQSSEVKNNLSTITISNAKPAPEQISNFNRGKNPALVPSSPEKEDMISVDAPRTDLDLAVPPQPLVRPKKNFIQPDASPVKISFKR